MGGCKQDRASPSRSRVSKPRKWSGKQSTCLSMITKIQKTYNGAMVGSIVFVCIVFSDQNKSLGHAECALSGNTQERPHK